MVVRAIRALSPDPEGIGEAQFFEVRFPRTPVKRRLMDDCYFHCTCKTWPGFSEWPSAITR
jgi:hypothetical protein